ncbi:MAG: hypothetical protein KBB95_22115 [Deltaproteobacteria bacterium]|nr:hypothetical protein [Deltaproteobacteria bacterium]
MAKAASPVRLQADLMEAATIAGELHHRSAAEQVEYWASIGRSVSQLLTPEVLLSIRTGLARLRVEPVGGVALDADAVFDALEADRAAGTLADSVTSSALRYQPSSAQAGYLEQHHSDGRVVVGQFRDGRFVPARAKKA